jgi:hypothetical protein
MKNRYVGEITVKTQDGTTETCQIKTKSSKGEETFLEKIAASLEAILQSLQDEGKGNLSVKVSYRGDLPEKMKTIFPPGTKFNEVN